MNVPPCANGSWAFHAFEIVVQGRQSWGAPPRVRICRHCHVLEVRWKAAEPLPNTGPLDGVAYFVPWR